MPPNLLISIAIAFVIVTCAMILLAIGWLLTGKSKLKPGACGRDPNQNRDASCGTNTSSSCGLCKKNTSECDEEKK